MNLQKQAFLRLNIERMFYCEALKTRPELRSDPHMVNRIEKLIDLPRVERFKGKALEPERVRKVVEQAEAVYITSLLKSIVMSEIEEENPKFTQFIESFRVKRQGIDKPRFYALKAFEDNGGPIDHLVSKKQAINLMKSISINS